MGGPLSSDPSLAATSSGRPPRYRCGIDLGGTKISGVILGSDGQACWRERVSTPRHDYDATIRAIAALVTRGEQAVGETCTVGIGMPGTLSPATGLVKNANSTWLNGRPFKEDLERRLGRPLRLANDANCFAVSEATDGAASGADCVFGVILGTGTGGGLVVHGRLVTGANAIAGEWGHNPLPWPSADDLPGPDCYCGRRGCIETFLSGPAIAADYARRGGAVVSSEVVVRMADGGDALAQLALRTWTQRLARALAAVINVVDPDVIVIGGGLSRLESIYAEVPALWPRWVFSDTVVTRLVPAAFGDDSGVRGAAWLWD